MKPTSTVTPISETHKEPQQRQSAKELIAANVQSLIEQLEAGKSDALDRIPERDEPIPQLQLRKHLGDCTVEAGCDARSRNVRMESAWPQGDEGTEGHPHSRSHHRLSTKEGR